MKHAVTLDSVVAIVLQVLDAITREKRARSIAFGAFGAMHAERLTTAEVGRAMARVRGTSAADSPSKRHPRVAGVIAARRLDRADP